MERRFDKPYREYADDELLDEITALDQEIFERQNALKAEQRLLRDQRIDFAIAMKELRRRRQECAPEPPSEEPQEAKPLPVLSDREREIAAFIVGGLSNKQIADRAGLADSTIKNHVASIMQKLHVSNRAQIAVEAVKQGVGSPIARKCFHCGVAEGRVRMQPVDGIDGELECRDQVECEQRITASAA